jgi:hypothetical protein
MLFSAHGTVESPFHRVCEPLDPRYAYDRHKPSRIQYLAFSGIDIGSATGYGLARLYLDPLQVRLEAPLSSVGDTLLHNLFRSMMFHTQPVSQGRIN